MTKITFVLIYIFLSFAGLAQKQQTREEYIKKYQQLAISEMERSGVPASITLAQGCWESQNGNSRLATEGNNHFGIKCKSEWTGKKIYHDDDAKQECFRKYAHAEESYIDHSNFLKNSSRYSSLFQLDRKDYVGWAKGLKKAGYATDPNYAERLIKTIEDYKLFVYDEYYDNRQIATKGIEKKQSIVFGPVLGKTNASHKVELRNGLQSIVIAEGDTYESIRKDLGLKEWELYTYNDFSNEKKLRVSEILYIEAKHKKADRNHKLHVADKDDTMHYISQRYGLKLKPLLRRNRMKDGQEPETGQTVYLRNKKPRKE
jgi:hypothetical protein